MKIAVVHPWFLERCGGDGVIEAFARLYPTADFFVLMADKTQIPSALKGRNISATFLDYVPKPRRYYQHLSPLYPMAAQTLDVSGYDLVISSGGPAAKNVRIGPGALHVHYCHSPVRFLWDQFPVWEARLPGIVRPLFRANCSYLRKWDYEAAQRVDAFIANSDYVGERIRTFYNRTSTTIYPPVEIQPAFHGEAPGDYYLFLGRLVAHKRVDLLVEACNKMGRRLIIIGSGPEEARLRLMAGPTVTLTGHVDDAAREAYYRGARAYMFAGEEDFGIATVEAQSYGLPAIAFGKGGTAEIVDDGPDCAVPTGVLFQAQDVESIVAAIATFEAKETSFDREAIWRRSRRFEEAVFARRIAGFIDTLLAERRLHLDGRGAVAAE